VGVWVVLLSDTGLPHESGSRLWSGLHGSSSYPLDRTASNVSIQSTPRHPFNGLGESQHSDRTGAEAAAEVKSRYRRGEALRPRLPVPRSPARAFTRRWRRRRPGKPCSHAAPSGRPSHRFPQQLVMSARHIPW
jgi:hypothetical protein